MKPILAVVVFAVLLGGCAAAGEAAPSAAPSVTITPTPTPTETEEPAPTVKPALSELVLSPEGLGPIRLGQPYEPTGESSVLVWDTTWCDFAEDVDVARVDTAGWKATYPDKSFWVYLASRVESAPVSEVVVISSEPRTKEGIGNGSAVADMHAAYGSALVEIPSDVYPGYALRGAAYQLVFWVDAYEPETIWLTTIGLVSDAATPPMSNGCD